MCLFTTWLKNEVFKERFILHYAYVYLYGCNCVVHGGQKIQAGVLSSCVLSVLGAKTQTVLWKSSKYFLPRRHRSSAKEESSQSLMEGKS